MLLSSALCSIDVAQKGSTSNAVSYVCTKIRFEVDRVGSSVGGLSNKENMISAESNVLVSPLHSFRGEDMSRNASL